MHFLSMEYVRGEELSSLLKRVGRLPREKAIELARQLCAGLAAIHAAGVLHRDLKPANVMIDEHGDVRITDFGIAALTESAAQEALIGTPKYIAPEQFAGEPPSIRSDLYALGLVLQHAFTGSDDPDIERVILRCLDKDPRRRPESALQVAAVLPGGDPLAAALAAGETPSPQMVAASASEGRLAPLTATLLLAWILAALVLTALLSGRTSLHRFMSLNRSPELLRADAEEIAREAGYTAPADVVSGFRRHLRVLDHVKDWTRFRADPLPAIYFFQRRSPRPLEPYSSWRVDERDPPNLAPGMVSLRLDTRGRLLSFEAVPPAQQARVDWSRFFTRAGLALSAFHPVAPRSSNAQLAWEGMHPTWPNLPLRVEAASYRGAPVYFEVMFPWSKHSTSEEASDPFTIVLLTFYFGTIALAVLLAWRNLRLGRGDRRGTFRLMLFIFALRVVFWLFVAHHVPVVGELGLVISGLEAAVYWAAILGLFYLALEPLVRRRLPEALISWSRLLAGDWRDPMIGRDVLLGGAFGMVIVLTIHLYPRRGPAVNSSLLNEFGLDGWRGFVPLLVNQTTASIMFPLIITAATLFFILITRRHAIGLAVSWLIFYAALNLNFGDRGPLSLAIGVILPTVLLFVLTRYGLLALVATFFYIHIWPFYPATTELTAWYATTYIMAVILLVALALYAWRVSLAGQKVISGAFLE